MKEIHEVVPKEHSCPICLRDINYYGGGAKDPHVGCSAEYGDCLLAKKSWTMKQWDEVCDMVADVKRWRGLSRRGNLPNAPVPAEHIVIPLWASRIVLAENFDGCERIRVHLQDPGMFDPQSTITYWRETIFENIVRDEAATRELFDEMNRRKREQL